MDGMVGLFITVRKAAFLVSSCKFQRQTVVAQRWRQTYDGWPGSATAPRTLYSRLISLHSPQNTTN